VLTQMSSNFYPSFIDGQRKLKSIVN